MDELKFLRAKDEVFQNSDLELQKSMEKCENLEREIERQKAELEDNDFNLRVL
jgi:hypothetical protein